MFIGPRIEVGMNIHVSLEDEIAVLRIEGRLWGEEDSVELDRMIDDTLDRGCTRFVADLAGVPIMNSSGLGSLIAAMKKIRSGEGEMVLTGVNDRLDHLFRITRLYTVFKTYDDVDAAVENMHA